MSDTIKSTVRVFIEQGLPEQTWKADAKSQLQTAPRFRVFRYTPKGQKPGKIVEVGKAEKSSSAGTTVTVFRFAKPGDLIRARNLARGSSAETRSMIAVTSPYVFNQPKLRSVLADAEVEVLVEGPDQFQVSHLAPWIAKIIHRSPQQKFSSRTEEPPTLSLPALDPLDISKRLRDPVSGRLDARKIAALVGISMTDLATKVCRVTRQALSQRSTSAGIQEKLQPLEDVAQALLWCGDDEPKLRAWLNRPNRDFPMIESKVPSPMDLILRGHAGIVASKVHNLRTGHPA